MENKKLTGYPSIDKPWLKYYSEEAINAPLPECTLWQYLWENNKEYLFQTAITYYGKDITYACIFDEIKKYVASFVKLGIKKGDYVTIMSMQTPETIACIYALNYLGAVCNMVYVTLTQAELVRVLENTNSKALFVLDLDIEKINRIAESVEIPVITLSVNNSMPTVVKVLMGFKGKKTKIHNKVMQYKDFISLGKGETIPECEKDADAIAIIVYTSGTTGEPKGVMLSNRNVNTIALECQVTHCYPNPRGQTFLNAMPPFLGYGIAMMNLAFCSGIVQIILLSSNPDEIAKAVVKYKPNRIVYGPKLAEALIRNVKGDLSFLMEYAGGGEAISEENEKAINSFLPMHGANIKYTGGYGMSEAASAVCSQQNQIDEYKYRSVGIPYPPTNVKVVDTDTDKELEYNKIGELCFSTPSLMVGYYKNKQATDQVIKVDEKGTRWIHTGDLGYVDEDGFIFIKGRMKRIFTTFGSDGSMYKLFPQRIEEFISKMTEVLACGIVVKESPENRILPLLMLN